MHIAMTGNVFPFGPAKAYGGERVIHYLVRGLGELGHDVVVFDRPQTDLGPASKAAFVPVPAAAQPSGCDPFVPAAADYEARMGRKFDVYQCNYFGERWDREALTRWNYCELVWCDWCHIKDQTGARAYNTVCYSKALGEDMMKSGRAATMIHYGVPFEDYAADRDHDGYLVWIGKIEGGKGLEWAMEVAVKAKKRLVIMGPPYNTSYFRQSILPRMYPLVTWLRGCTDEIKARVFRRAQAFLSANVDGWREHLGIVNLEALASGCPVIAWSRESSPSAVVTDEIIKPGRNGEILSYGSSGTDWADVVRRGAELVEKVAGYDRRAIREEAQPEWSHLTMARRWAWFYEQIQGRRRLGPVTLPS